MKDVLSRWLAQRVVRGYTKEADRIGAKQVVNNGATSSSLEYTVRRNVWRSFHGVRFVGHAIQNYSSSMLVNVRGLNRVINVGKVAEGVLHGLTYLHTKKIIHRGAKFFKDPDYH